MLRNRLRILVLAAALLLVTSPVVGAPGSLDEPIPTTLWQQLVTRITGLLEAFWLSDSIGSEIDPDGLLGTLPPEDAGPALPPGQQAASCQQAEDECGPEFDPNG
jgi:hypothetical protein